MIDLDKLERLLADATPGEWQHDCNGVVWRVSGSKPHHLVADFGNHLHDAELTVAMREALPGLIAEARDAARLRVERDTPELHDFARGVVLEAQHQRSRWGSDHDAGKAPADWFWLLGYLGGKALAAALAGNTEKALHHCVSSAAALANWHAALSGQHTDMRPGIDAPEEGGDHG